jgi:hypothetical protein
MGEFNIDELLPVIGDPEEGRRRVAADRRLMLDSTPEQLREALSSLLSPADAAWFTDDRMREATAQMKEGLEPGDAGYWEDTRAQFMPGASTSSR